MTCRTSQSCYSALVALAVGAGMGLMVGGCSWVPKGDPQFDIGIKDRGIASWYGGQFHGKQAANGRVYDMEGLTAAHRTMPLGSIIRVRNLENGKYVFVQVTDRGPYVNGRILDLSHAAAVRLGMERGGLAHVLIEIVGERRPGALLSSDALPTASVSMTVRTLEDTSRNEADPLLNVPIRVVPSDLWLRRGIRRVPAMLEADHTAHIEVVALVIG